MTARIEVKSWNHTSAGAEHLYCNWQQWSNWDGSVWWNCAHETGQYHPYLLLPGGQDNHLTVLWSLVLNRHTIHATIGTSMLHAIFLSKNLDDNSSCEVGLIHFPNRKTIGGGGLLKDCTRRLHKKKNWLKWMSLLGQFCLVFWCAGKGFRQEPHGQPVGHCGVGIGSHGLPWDGCAAVQRALKNLYKPNKHVRR